MSDQDHGTPGSSKAPMEAPITTPEDNSATSSLINPRLLRIVILRARLGGRLRKGPPPMHDKRIEIGHNSTFKFVHDQLQVTGEGRWTLLDTNYSPVPYWLEANLEALIPATCQTLYAVHTRDAARYVLAVVRSSQSDYPLLMVEPREGLTLNVYQVIIEMDGDLEAMITSITGYSYTKTVRREPYDYELLKQREAETFPTAFIVTAGEPPALLQLDIMPSTATPPFLQIPLVACKDLLRRSYHLKAFSLEMIYMSSALLHAICSLSKVLNPDEHDPRVEDVLQVSLTLAADLQKFLDDLRSVVEELEKEHPDETTIPHVIDQAYLGLCGEYPGAVNIRRSGSPFDRLKAPEQEDDRVRAADEEVSSRVREMLPVHPGTIHAPRRSALVPTNIARTPVGPVATLSETARIAGDRSAFIAEDRLGSASISRRGPYREDIKAHVAGEIVGSIEEERGPIQIDTVARLTAVPIHNSGRPVAASSDTVHNVEEQVTSRTAGPPHIVEEQPGGILRETIGTIDEGPVIITGTSPSIRNKITGSKRMWLSEEDKVNDSRDGINTPKRSTIRTVVIMAACTGSFFLDAAGAGAIWMAIPTIAHELQMPANSIPWIVSASCLSSGCLILFFARLADLYDPKFIWFFGIVWLMASSIGCSFVQTGTQLITLRAMHGIGQAAVFPTAIGIGRERVQLGVPTTAVLAAISVVSSLGGPLGMLLGGVIAQYATWKGIFWFIAILSAVVGVTGLVAIDTHAQKHDLDLYRGVDWMGTFLITAGLVLLTVALSEAPTAGWGTPLIISLLVLGVILVVLFLLWEIYAAKRYKHLTFMPLDILTCLNGRFGALQAVVFMECACFTTVTFWGNLYYQNYFGLDPIHAMIRFIPMQIMGGICNVLLAWLARYALSVKVTYLLVLTTGTTSIAALLFALINPSSLYWSYGFSAAILCVFGVHFAFQVTTSFTQQLAQPRERLVASTVSGTASMLGTTFGLAITTITQAAGRDRGAAEMGVTVLTNSITQDVPPEVLLRGYRAAQWTSFAFGVTGMILTVLFLPSIGVVDSMKDQTVATPEKPQPDAAREGKLEIVTSKKQDDIVSHPDQGKEEKETG